MIPVAGDELAPYVVDVTLQRLVMEAGANRDFSAIHFDPEAARESGAPTAYANTTFVETLLEALVRTWAGLDARITMIEFRMIAFNNVGDTVTASGTVTEVREDDDGLVADLALRCDTQAAQTVAGSATVVFPTSRPPSR